MTCRDIQNQLSAYHDGELDAAQREAVTLHLQTCPACRAYLARIAALGHVLRAGASSDVPDFLLARVLRTVTAGRPRHRLREWGIRITAAAAGFALCVVTQQTWIVKHGTSAEKSAETIRVVESSLNELRGVVAGASLRDEDLDAFARRPEVMLVQELTQRVQP